MLKQTLAAALLAGGLIVAAGPAHRAEAAVPLAKLQTGDAAKSDVVKVKQGFRGGGFGGFRGGGFKGFSGGNRGNFGNFRSGGFKGYRGGGRRFYGGGYGGLNRPWRGRRYGYRRSFGPSIYIGSGYRSCGYLRRRAAVTGSRYWLRRYNACRYGW